METNILFKNYTDNKRIYNLNEGFWARSLKHKLKLKVSDETKLFKNVDAAGIKFYDGNPMFTYINPEKTKGIRIIQPDKEDLEDYEGDINYLISAYIDTIFYKGEQEVPELVIVLVPSRRTVDKAMELITIWLKNGLTDEIIEEMI